MHAGTRNTWIAKKRLRVAPPTVSPPKTKCASAPPRTGTRPACSAAMTTDHTAVWSQRRSWPVNPIRMVKRSRSTPVSQFISRGYLYAPKRKVCTACTPTMSTIAEAP